MLFVVVVLAATLQAIPAIPAIGLVLVLSGALDGSDAATRAFLLADFHVCLAECLGHRLLADMLRDLTARTTIVATLYQSSHDARASCADHARIVERLADDDIAGAERLMLEHIGSVESALGKSMPDKADAREQLRAILAPVPRPKLAHS